MPVARYSKNEGKTMSDGREQREEQEKLRELEKNRDRSDRADHDWVDTWQPERRES